MRKQDQVLQELAARAAREAARERMFKQFGVRYDQDAAAMRWPFIRHGTSSTGSECYVYSGAGERICIGDRMHSPSGLVIVVPDHGDLMAPTRSTNTFVLVRPEGGDEYDIYWSIASGLIHEMTDIESVEKYLNG